jgi:uncharacterized protein
MFTREFVIKKSKSYIYDLLSSGLIIEKAYLYGSYARNEQNENSDIDIALVSDEFTDFGFEDRNKFGKINIRKEYLDIETKAISSTTFNSNTPFIKEIKNTGIELRI